MAKNLYFVEVTDTYGGEANYSWVTRHVISAKSPRGVASAISRDTGLHWKFDGTRYNSASGATCFFVEEYDPEIHESTRIDGRDDRS